jgi:hypothetical protein
VATIEYEVKVAYEGDDLVLSHRWQGGDVTVPYDSEEWTAADAAKDLIGNLHDLTAQIDVSADIPGGRLYLLTEEAPDAEYDRIVRNVALFAGPDPVL